MKNAGFGIALSSLALLIGCNENPSNPAVESGHRIKTETEPYIVSPYTKGVPVMPPQDRSAKFSGLAKTAGSAWIGLVSKFNSGTCNDGTSFYSLIRTDDEDDDNQNYLNLLGSNKNNVGGLYNSNGGIGASTVTFCQTLVSSLPRAKFDYAVLNPFSSSCPTNGQRIHIHIDNEDDDNNNYDNNSTALMAPMGVSGGNSEWYFCFVAKDAINGQSFPQIGNLDMDNWMIWAKEKGSYFGYHRVDDEDDANENSCRIAGTSNACPAAFSAFVNVSGGTGGHNWAWSAKGPTHPSFQNASPPATCTKPTCVPGSTPLCIIEWNNYNMCSN